MGRRGTGAVLAIAGASGGVGASALAAAVAVRACRAGADVVLVDADPLGGGLDVTLGVEQQPGIRWPDLGDLVGAADGRALLARLPAADDVPVLSFDRVEAHPPREVADAVLAALVAECELVVVDVGLGRGPVSDAALDAAAQVVVVAADGFRQMAALSVALAHVRGRDTTRVVPETAVCLRGRRASLGAPRRLVETEMGVPAGFTLDDDAGVRADGVHGIPPGSRGGGAMVATADEVLGWAVLPRSAVA